MENSDIRSTAVHENFNVLPVPVQERFEQRHRQLQHDYRTEDGKYREGCLHVAVEMSRLLEANGRKTKLISVVGHLKDDINRETLVPRAYGGRIRWGAHIVCVLEEENMVYDPMLDAPLSLQDYLVTTFTEPALFEILDDVKLDALGGK